MAPSSIKIGKEQLSILAYADVLIGKYEIKIRQLFLEMENTARKLGLLIIQQKERYVTEKRKKYFKTK
jgi:hypothetical protein